MFIQEPSSASSFSKERRHCILQKLIQPVAKRKSLDRETPLLPSNEPIPAPVAVGDLPNSDRFFPQQLMCTGNIP